MKIDTRSRVEYELGSNENMEAICVTFYVSDKILTMTTMHLFMLSILPGLQSMHFNCPHICNSTGEQDDLLTSRDGPAVGDNVQAEGGHCYGKICVATIHEYSNYEIPHAWSVPLHGENVCKKKLYLMEIETMFDVSKVRGIDENNGFVEIDMSLTMSWEDPNIDLCVCDDHPSAERSCKVGRNLEDVIWIPDLHVWNLKSSKRINGIDLLNDMELKALDNCPVQITWGFDLQVKLMCQMTMDWYPYDQNICHVKFGSLSHLRDDLVFVNGDRTLQHSFAKESYKDYKFKVIPLCDHQTEMEVTDNYGETSVYMVSGFSLVITRNPSRVFYMDVLVLSILVSIAIFSTCLPLESNRATLVASIALSVIFLLVHIDDSTPQGKGGKNLVLTYASVCLGITLITFMEYCFLRAILRWSTFVPEKSTLLEFLERLDKVFFIVLCLAFILFNAIWWQWPPGFSTTQCHNVDYSDVDCSISEV